MGLSVALLAACSPTSDVSSEVQHATEIEHHVSADLHDYLTRNHWGDHHMIFHATRRWFVGGQRLRHWLRTEGEGFAHVQEGEPTNGLEFLAMHRAMIEHLEARFPGAIDGWETDEDLLRAIDHFGEGRERDAVVDALVAINDFDAFDTEDAWGLFVETRLRRTDEVDPFDSSERFYRKDPTPGAGVHNLLHGVFADPDSPIDVSNAQLNLSNRLFWGIHQWVDHKWTAFMEHHARDGEERELFDRQMERFRLHVQIIGDHEHVDAPPPAVADELCEKLLTDEILCVDLYHTATMPDCIE